MSEPLHIRVVSIVLALSVVVGGALLLDYSNHSSQHGTSAVIGEQIATEDANRQEPATEVAANPPSVDRRIFPENMAVTYKCEKGGHISFGDQPCASNEKTLSITAAERAQPEVENHVLESMKESAVAMAAARHQRDRELDLMSAATVSNTIGGSPDKTMRCEQIDKAIAACDSILRQPHSAYDGDYWTGERKKLNDERFSIGC